MNEDIIFLVLFFTIVFIGSGIRRYYSYKIEKNSRRLSVRERVVEMIHAEGRVFAVLYFASSAYNVIDASLKKFYLLGILVT